MQGGLKSYFDFEFPTSSTRVFRVNSGYLFIEKKNNIFNMKSFVLAAVLCCTFAVAFGAVQRSIEQEKTYSEAWNSCNSLYPSEDPVIKMTEIIVNREPLGHTRSFGSTIWCNLNCILEKVRYYNPDGSLNIPYILEFLLDRRPELASSTPLLHQTLLQIDDSTKDMSDKCSKSFISYYRFTEAFLLSIISSELQAKPYVKEKVVDALVGGNKLPRESDTITQKSVQILETFFDVNNMKRCL